MDHSKTVKKILLWILAFVITAFVLVFQRLTGPTYPLVGKTNIRDSIVSYRLERSHVNTEDYELEINIPNTNIQGFLLYRIYRSQNEWTKQELIRQGDFLKGKLPKQPAAGKLEYKVILKDQHKETSLSGDTPVVIRFKGKVPTLITLIHVVTIFASFLFSFRAGLEALIPESDPRKLGLWAAAFLFAGGMIFGPLMQKFSFGSFWTGFPVGKDLTDTKTLVALVFWIAALWVSRKKSKKTCRRWILAASCVMLVVFLIPHSLLGSEFDYSQVESEEQNIKTNLDYSQAEHSHFL
jgi:hypothetical protein